MDFTMDCAVLEWGGDMVPSASPTPFEPKTPWWNRAAALQHSAG
jgi:hypothetical protein